MKVWILTISIPFLWDLIFSENSLHLALDTVHVRWCDAFLMNCVTATRCLAVALYFRHQAHWTRLICFVLIRKGVALFPTSPCLSPPPSAFPSAISPQQVFSDYSYPCGSDSSCAITLVYSPLIHKWIASQDPHWFSDRRLHVPSLWLMLPRRPRQTIPWRIQMRWR